MNAAPLPTEITMLVWTCVLFIVQLMLQAAVSVLDGGLPYAFGPRDEPPAPGGVYSGRIARALRNTLETFPLFAAVVLAVTVTGRTGRASAIGAELYFWMRVAYIPLYAAGIPILRSLVWLGSMIGILMMVYSLLAH